jgi:3D-(3,5/4)-trihydroxycyclohexane-1,2-dione acylhydrolase (decyclizing)
MIQAHSPGRFDTERLTTAQAIIRFLMAQQVSRDGSDPVPFFGGLIGIFGHGNLAGMGQAMLQYRNDFRFLQARNEQGMVHMASGYAKMRNRLGTLACSTSVGPGATNMVTGAALATVNRLPVLLFPSDTFATRMVGPVLQQLEYPGSQDASANDAFRSVSRYFDRINRPEQLTVSLLEAMRVLTSPADTGAATIALPEDVQAEAFDFPSRLFMPRVWEIPRQRADRRVIERAAHIIASAKKPFIIAGGGVIYSDATDALRQFVEATGIPIGETQAGKGSLPFDHPLNLGAFGASGTRWANEIGNDADVVIGIGTRYTDFTTGSKTMFTNPDVQFVNINVAELDSFKHAGLPVTGDARATLEELVDALQGYRVPAEFRVHAERNATSWLQEADGLVAPVDGSPLAQVEVVRLVDESAEPQDVVVGAAGSLPGDLHRLWRSRDPKSYHMEYGYSCMGYEIAGGVGAKIGDPSRTVYVMVGDGSYLMMSQDIMTAVQERLPIIVILVDNEGYGCIEALSRVSGSEGFGTRFEYRTQSGQLDGGNVNVDLGLNARSLGADVYDATSRESLKEALVAARETGRTSVIHVRVDRNGRFGGSGAWWDVPVAEVSTLPETQKIRKTYEENASRKAYYL